MNSTRAGFVAVVGKPNAGKSTLLNRLVGQKLAITSPKPQSTRDKVVGIVTRNGYQIVLLDTPGLLVPNYLLQEAMQSTALRALDDADVIVYLIDGTDGTAGTLAEAANLKRTPRANVITAVNKSDAIAPQRREKFQTEIPDVVFISALTGEGVADLEKAIATQLPESPFLYPEDELSTQNVRFFVAELIRETALETLREEIPYSIACAVEEFREGRSPQFIRAVIYVERESQKGIVVGARGGMIKKIGELARKKIELFLDDRVYLELQVKVLANWRKNASSLQRFGYQLSKEKQR